MRLSISLTSYTTQEPGSSLPQRLTELARAADHSGIDTVWLADHLLQTAPGTSVGEPMLEAFTTLGHLAAVTSRVRLGTMVAAATYRAPALLIKAVTTLDVLSGGRAWLGVGAGYQADEAEAMGLDLPGTAERFERLEELLELATRMFAGDASSYAGTHHRLGQPVNSPPPVARPPILVGGAGERRTLPLVARYADACNLFDIPDEGATIRHKLRVLRELCDREGRDVQSLDRSVSTWWAPGTSAAQLADHLAALASYGATHAVLIRPSLWTHAEVTALAEVVDAVRGEGQA